MRFVLEGLPGAGKTTYSRRLVEQFNIALIPGLMRPFMREWTHFRLHKPYYKANDELKEFVAQQFAERILLFDRCYVSTLAYAHALTQKTGANRNTGQCYADQLEWYQKCIAQGTLVRPDVVVVLDIPPELSIERKPNAHSLDRHFADVAFLESIREYYQLFYSLIETEVTVFWLNVDRPADTVYADVLAIFQAQAEMRDIDVNYRVSKPT